MKLLIGLDIGTTALKAAVFDTAGKLLAVSTQEYDLITPQVNYVEEKGEVYWNAFKHAVADLKEKQIRAQFFGGVMGPVMNNLSQLNYGLTACIGGLLCVFRNFDVGGLTVF